MDQVDALIRLTAYPAGNRMQRIEAIRSLAAHLLDQRAVERLSRIALKGARDERVEAIRALGVARALDIELPTGPKGHLRN